MSWEKRFWSLLNVLPDYYTAIPRGRVHVEEWLASGFYFEPSAFSAEVFYIEAFVIPTFAPTEYLYFDYGFRVGSWEAPTVEAVQALAQARLELERRATLEHVLACADRPSENPYHLEVHVGIAVLREDHGLLDEARKLLEAWCVGTEEPEWIGDVVGRTEELAAAASDWDHARDLLVSRREQTLLLFGGKG